MITEKVKENWVYLIAGLFIAFNCYLLTKDLYYGLLLPLVLFIALFYIVALDKVILFITFLTPLAVNIQDLDFGVGVSLPTEPLMFGVLFMFVFKLLYDLKYDSRIMRHPLTLVIIFQLVWMFITSITSELPVVSFKYLLSRLWFVIPFYFLGILLFKKYRNIRYFFWLYAIPLIAIVIYTTYNHAKYGFSEESGHWVMSPFYNDHTAYGAILAMFIPVMFGLSFNRMSIGRNRFFAFIIMLILLAAFYLSSSRAAWISLVGAIGIFILIKLKIKFYWIFIVTTSLVIIFFAFQHQILDRLEKNKQDSSANFVEHVQSITNISSDASNLERINRWQSAIRLFEERPFFGWGPGTYQFVYAPYQRSKEKTIISTNAGDMGNAHSEYIGPMSEMGVIGMLSVILVVVISFLTGLKIYKNARSWDVRLISLVTLLGLVTYFLHGILNNFLDTDKLSVPFWGFMGILVALDLYHSNKPDEKIIKEMRGQDEE
ncbi:MAG: O-antigen ligase family protein [Bacteroidales bacterium]|nr:O-antigen ligase family protein [Bacteroidales bacterium]MCF8387200.1 O-antigen ligase family protein [Bacteroidales bacterium]MCF8396757.1 O-antigen ligase family protein [Bacteroidales bacterium]